MPMVGVDWSQTGVAHLFSAIKVCCVSSYALIIRKIFKSCLSLKEVFYIANFLL